MKKIIINADDFGYSKVFNESILFLLKKDKIDNVSVMVDYVQDSQKGQIERQYKKFFNIFGFYPVFLDMHKYSYREKWQETIKKFAFENNLFFRPFQNNKKGLTTSWKVLTGSFKKFEEIKREIISIDDNNSFVILFHPGSFDPDSISSFNQER